MADESQKIGSEQSSNTHATTSPLADLFQDTIERVARLDNNAHFLSANNQFADLFGFSTSEMIGMSVIDLLVSEDHEKAKSLIADMQANGRSEEILRAKTKAGDNSYIKILLSKGIAKADSSYFCYCFVDLINPDELSKHVETIQSKSVTTQSTHEQYRTLVDNLNVIVWECSYPDFKYNFISQSLSPVLGFSVSDWLGTIKFNPDYIHPEDIQQVLDSCLNSAKHGKDFELVYRIKNKHGQYIWLQDIISVVLDENQQVYQLRGISIDVSANKIEEQVETNSRRRIYKIFDHMPNAVFQTRLKDGVVTRINSGFSELTGYQPEDILGRGCVDINFISEEVNRELSDRLKSVGKISDLKIPFKSKDGKTCLMNVSAVLIIDEKTPYMFMIANRKTKLYFQSVITVSMVKISNCFLKLFPFA